MGCQLTPINKNMLQFPGALVAARKTKQISQKSLSLMAHVDQSHLCLMEKGRGSVPTAQIVDRLATALELDESDRRALAGRAAHDRVLHVANQFDSHMDLELLSFGLQAATSLGQIERKGITQYLGDVVRSQRILAGAAGWANPTSREPK